MGSDGWTQVYLGGLNQTAQPTDLELEHLWEQRWDLSQEQFTWAGPGSSVVKRADDGVCRGFAFLSFYSLAGAMCALDVINHHEQSQCQAELCKPKRKKPAKAETGQNLPNLRLRRQRKAPVAKHPVIVSSNGKKTGLGSKTR